MTDRILILAAGASRRMQGRDKLLEQVEGRPLLQRQAMIALGLGWPVHVALPPVPHPRHDALKNLDIGSIAVPECREGMGGSLRGAVARLPQDTTGLMLILGDLPELTTEDLGRLVAARSANPNAAIWRGATADGAAGHPILFAAETLPAFAALAGDDGGKAVLRAFSDRVCLVPLPGNRARRDLDTPEDWARWRAERQQQQQ